MPIVEAHIPTQRAGRYLVQFCKHASQMSRMHQIGGRMHHGPRAHKGGGGTPPTVLEADWSNTVGTIRFPQGRCTMWADRETLTLQVEAEDEDSLQRLQIGITQRLETIGRRDQLTVTWQPPNHTPSLPPAAVTTTPTPPRGIITRVRGRLGTFGLLALAALAILLHLGLLGGALAASTWAGWGVNAIIALVLVKVIIVGVHVVGGRVALRRGKNLSHRWKRHQPSSEHASRSEHTPPIDKPAAATAHDHTRP